AQNPVHIGSRGRDRFSARARAAGRVIHRCANIPGEGALNNRIGTAAVGRVVGDAECRRTWQEVYSRDRLRSTSCRIELAKQSTAAEGQGSAINEFRAALRSITVRGRVWIIENHGAGQDGQ